MHIHILGVCGTFMGSLALIARELGHSVSGSDKNVYPPMSTQLSNAGIDLYEGYDEKQFTLEGGKEPDLVIIGNAMSRGNPAVEYCLNQGLAYTSGPQWLAETVLKDRWVLAVSGTHGKTTTTSMLAWVLEDAGLQPGYLIGGVPANFEVSARLGESPFFVIEADEYDSAFFDKRSKFVHYRPRTAVLANLEFDHADIFNSLADIQKQFHHLVRTIPAQGKVLCSGDAPALVEVLEQGCWSEVESLGVTIDGRDKEDTWRSEKQNPQASVFNVLLNNDVVGVVKWELEGEHNMRNALAAIAAARHAGVKPAQAISSLNTFLGVKRRMENLGEVKGKTVFDDFAHHPTAIKTTLSARKQKNTGKKLIAVIEPRSNTMRMGTHRDALNSCVEDADEVYWYQPENAQWDMAEIIENSKARAHLFHNTQGLVEALCSIEGAADIIIMSNGGFDSIHKKLLSALESA